MTSRSILAGFAILLVTPFGQQSLQRNDDSKVSITYYGGSGSNLLRECQTALKIGMGENGTFSVDTAATSMQDAVQGSFCEGYVVGVVDTLISVSNATKTNYCIPTNADGNQFVRVVAKYLNDNPAQLNSPASILVSSAIIDAFPCK